VVSWDLSKLRTRRPNIHCRKDFSSTSIYKLWCHSVNVTKQCKSNN